MYCRQCGNIGRPVLFAAANRDICRGVVLQLLREGIRRRRPESWATRKVFLQHGKCAAACCVIRQKTFFQYTKQLYCRMRMFCTFVTLRLFLIVTTDTSTDSPSLY